MTRGHDAGSSNATGKPDLEAPEEPAATGSPASGVDIHDRRLDRLLDQSSWTGRVIVGATTALAVLGVAGLERPRAWLLDPTEMHAGLLLVAVILALLTAVGAARLLDGTSGSTRRSAGLVVLGLGLTSLSLVAGHASAAPKPPAPGGIAVYEAARTPSSNADGGVQKDLGENAVLLQQKDTTQGAQPSLNVFLWADSRPTGASIGSLALRPGYSEVCDRGWEQRHPSSNSSTDKLTLTFLGRSSTTALIQGLDFEVTGIDRRPVGWRPDRCPDRPVSVAPASRRMGGELYEVRRFEVALNSDGTTVVTYVDEVGKKAHPPSFTLKENEYEQFEVSLFAKGCACSWQASLRAVVDGVPQTLTLTPKRAASVTVDPRLVQRATFGCRRERPGCDPSTWNLPGTPEMPTTS